MQSAGNSHSKGFTLIELVIVLVILGILSVVIMPRFMSSSTFNPVVARDALITTARLARQSAMGRDNATLSVALADDAWTFRASGGGQTLLQQSVAAGRVTIGASSGGGCGGASPISGSFQVRYDGYGNVAGHSGGGGPGNNVRFCINNDPALSVCISPAGYAHAGSCRD